MTEELRILTPQGMLGYGVPAEHFWRGKIGRASCRERV